MMTDPVIHERAEWLAGYAVASGEGSAWWGGNTWPGDAAITNLTWHYPGGTVTNNAGPDSRFAAELRSEQAAYHRRRDGGSTGRPSPFDQGYDLGYNAMIDVTGGLWKVRWTDKRSAANGSTASNAVSFAVQFMTANLDADLTDEQVATARWVDQWARSQFPNMPDGVGGHKCHSDWFATACPGDVIRPRVRAGDLLWREPLDPTEDDMSDAQYAALNVKLDTVIRALTASPAPGVGSVEWDVHGLADWSQKHAADLIAAAVWKTQPPSSATGLTADQVVAALVASEDFQQSLIKAFDRLLSDESLVFKRA